MPFRVSERTSRCRALSMIARLVLSRVSLRALRTNSSSISMFVLAILITIHHLYRIRCRQMQGIPLLGLRLPVTIQRAHASDGRTVGWLDRRCEIHALGVFLK